MPRRALGHFLPLAFSILYLLIALDSRTDAAITLLFEVLPFAERPSTFNMFFLLDLAVVPLYLGLSWRWLDRHQKQIDERYSYRKTIDYRWLRRLVIAMAGAWAVIDLPIFGSLFTDSFSERQGLALGFSLTSLLVFYLGYHGFRQATVYAAAPEPVPLEAAAETGARYRRSGLSDDEVQACEARLLVHMETDRPYLDCSLSIRGLAGAVGLSEHNASEVINVGLGETFYEFVNGYRVEEFRRRALQEENAGLTLLA